MRHRKYQVVLSGRIAIINAFNEKEAIILAQAEAIRNAKNYDLVSIQDVTDVYEEGFGKAIRRSLNEGSFVRAITGQLPKDGDACKRVLNGLLKEY
ncbi:hypothetical protein [Paenibacillus dendritiformis]|uniref:hypothetical protein n=1 Tax=Paenibacillus dendritiformis TaxID=130049 RepID=UPI00387E1A93